MEIDFIRFQVRAAFVKNYKHDRLYGRGEEYGDLIIGNAVIDLLAGKEVWIDSYGSKNGAVIKLKLDGNVLMQVDAD